MTFWQGCVLGAVQGVTEFLPISSSAHLVLFPWFFGWKDPGLVFDVFLHLGTLIAVFAYFARDWMQLVSAGLRSVIERRIGFERERMVFWLLVVGTIPAVIAGWLLHDYAATAFRAPLLTAMTLAGVGFLLYWADGKCPMIKHLEELRFKDAIWIGLAQACAIVPGVSRSGSTMTMGRVLGLKRRDAARFSFLLAFPITLGAGIFEWRSFSTELLAQMSVAPLIGGFLTSTIFGLLAIHFLLRLLQTSDFAVFCWYRVFLAGGILIWSILSGTK